MVARSAWLGAPGLEVEIRQTDVRAPSSDVPSPGAIHQRQRILQHRHHAEAEQIDLDDAHVGAVVLVPLNDDAVGHAGVLERHDFVEASLADTMPPECWPRCRGRSWICCQRRPNNWMPGSWKSMPASRRLRSSVSFGSTHSKWFMTFASRSICGGLDRQRLPHFARRAASAIGDHVGRHRRAGRPVLRVDVLDDPLAPIAARQVEIDVGPLAALLGQEPLEQQIHPDRIHRGDPQAVAHGAVGGRAAPLHEDVLLPAEVDDVPDDQEVAGEIELLDQIQLALDLRAGRDRDTAGSARARRPA